jgi:integrase
MVARRQYQHGSIRRKNKKWTLRYREYVYDPEGKIRAICRTRILLPASRPKSEARREADRFMARIGHGERTRTMMTFSEFWESHFMPNVIANLKPSTQAFYSTLAKTHIAPIFGGEQLIDITRLDVQRFINSKRIENYSPKTLSSLRNLLSKAFGSAVRWELIQENPAKGIELPPMARKREARILKQDEITKLAGKLKEPVRTIVMAGLLLGLRIGELLALQVRDVDLLSARIHIRRDVYRGKVGTPKTAASVRTLPLPGAALPLLAFHCQGKNQDNWLFPNAAGNPFDDRGLIRRQVEPVCDELKIPRFGWHALRHTFSTYGGNSGIAMPVLQSLLGHTSAEVTMRYTHPLEAAQRIAIENLAQQLWPVVAQNVEDGNRLSGATN